MTPPGAAGAPACPHCAPPIGSDPEQKYRAVIEQLRDAGVPFLVGGAYGLAWATNIEPRTKDLDLFIRRSDCRRALAVMTAAGHGTEMPFPHWLAKVHCGEHVIDLIFNSGNGRSPVDDDWFAHALPAHICGVPVHVCPLEEMLWTKAFVMERERYDGADVAHLLHAGAERIDWRRLLDRFADDWPVLLSHLTLFAYIYPGDAHRIPRAVMRELAARLDESPRAAAADNALCRGGLLSRAQYLVDLFDWGYVDARLPPHGSIAPDELAVWTQAAPSAPRAQAQSDEPGGLDVETRHDDAAADPRSRA